MDLKCIAIVVADKSTSVHCGKESKDVIAVNNAIIPLCSEHMVVNGQ